MIDESLQYLRGLFARPPKEDARSLLLPRDQALKLARKQTKRKTVR
jgi:hypothetical protein